MESEANFGCKEAHGSKTGYDPLSYPVNGGTDHWNAKVENVLPTDNDTYSSRKEDQKGHLYCLTGQDGDSDSFSSSKSSDSEDSMQNSEADTLILSTLPIQEFRTSCVLNLFLDPLDIEESTCKEIPSRKSVSENSSTSSAESESNEDAQAWNTSDSDAISENVKQQPANSRGIHKSRNVVDRNSTTIQIQCTCKDQDSENSDSQVIETLLTKHGHESITSQMQHDERESSFSASGHIAFSGSLADSGSLSLRSDSSARSFAFPILQSEWNGSPVSMAKADKRHFRKHRCWRSGLFCYRF